MIAAKSLRSVATYRNGNFEKSSQIEGIESVRELYKIISCAMQESLVGNYQYTYRPEEPMSKEVISVLRMYGFEVREENYTYIISWEQDG